MQRIDSMNDFFVKDGRATFKQKITDCVKSKLQLINF